MECLFVTISITFVIYTTDNMNFYYITVIVIAVYFYHNSHNVIFIYVIDYFIVTLCDFMAI